MYGYETTPYRPVSFLLTFSGFFWKITYVRFKVHDLNLPVTIRFPWSMIDGAYVVLDIVNEIQKIYAHGNVRQSTIRSCYINLMKLAGSVSVNVIREWVRKDWLTAIDSWGLKIKFLSVYCLAQAFQKLETGVNRNSREIAALCKNIVNCKAKRNAFLREFFFFFFFLVY